MVKSTHGDTSHAHPGNSSPAAFNRPISAAVRPPPALSPPTAMWAAHQADLENLIVRRGKCVSDSSAGRSLSPSLLCFRAQRPAKPTFRNPGVRTEQETNRGRQFALTVLITNAWKIRRAAAAWPTRGSNRSRRFQVRLPSCYRNRCTTHTIKSVPLNRGCEGVLRVTCEPNRPSHIPVSIRLRRRP